MSDRPAASFRAILLEARELRGQERTAFLDRACGGDEALRAAVEAHLDTIHLPLVTPPDGGDLDPAKEPLGEIGAYRLLEVIGEGGMGVVYRAEQTAPIRREVALKLIRRGLDTDRVVARFESERQALARMAHPAIARVLDAGAAPDGRPYFVMELVQGQPITAYSDARRLTVAERIELLVAVCQGVQHAHQKGIIHRDLKPTNLLVAEEHGVRTPKIIDFGIAKAIGEPLEKATALTREGQFVGTPDYMSPEQAGAVDADVDTRTDVYAIGVVAYELIAGVRPRRFEGRTQVEIQRTLKTHDPDRPSTAATGGRRSPFRATSKPSTDTAQRVATARQTSPDRLRRSLQGDLDNIVLKAIERDPARRYASMDHLAADLSHYLAGRPVEATANSWTYRTRKFVSRHRLGVGLAAAAAMVTIAFGASFAVQSAQVARERDRAVAAEYRARIDAQTTRRVSDFLIGLFSVSDPGEARGSTITAREILDRGAERVGTELAGEGDVQSRLLQTLGVVYKQLGLYDRSSELLTRAVRTREGLDNEDTAALIESLDALSDTERLRGNLDEAERLSRRAVEIGRTSFGPDDARLGQSLNNLALVRQEQGEYADAETLQRESLRIRRAAFGGQSEPVANSLSNLGRVLNQRGRPDEAATALSEALAIRRAVLPADHPLVASTSSALAQTFSARGRFVEAEPLFRAVLALREKTLGPAHPLTMSAKNDLASTLQDLGQLSEAERLYRDVLAFERRRIGTGESMELAIALNNLSSLFEDQGRPREGLPLLLESLKMRRDLRGAGHPAVATALNNLGRMWIALGEPARAQTFLREALAIRVERLGDGHSQVAVTRSLLGRALAAEGRRTEAERELRGALKVQEQTLEPTHASLATTRLLLALLLIDAGRPTEAEPLLVGCRAALAVAPPPRRDQYVEATRALARVYEATGRPSEAMALTQMLPR